VYQELWFRNIVDKIAEEMGKPCTSGNSLRHIRDACSLNNKLQAFGILRWEQERFFF
jgi:hypothetical protein